ncbi:hypothetical protein V7974_004679 [Vibrio parahaemolyticus]
MLILKKPDTTEIEVTMMAKISCCNCTNEEHTPAQTAEQAARSFQRLGWQTYETSDEITGNTCPRCIAELQQMEKDGEL